MNSINQKGSSQLSTETISERTDLNNQVKRTLNNSLWKVGKSTVNFESKKSEVRKIEKITEKKLENKLSTLSKKTDLNLENSKSKLDIEIEKGENGQPIAHINFPEGTNIKGKTPDNSTRIVLPVENLKTMVTPRFFLLQKRMDEFGKDLNNIERRWKYFEYALAYSQAWLTGKLKFSKKRSEALFQLALATHEIDKFGSTDYPTILRDLTNTSFSEIKLPTQIDAKSIKEPLNEKTIQNLSQNMKKSKSLLQTSENKLHKTAKQTRKVTDFSPEKIFSKQLEKLSQLEENNPNLKNKFLKICQKTENTYAFPQQQMKKALQNIQETKRLLKKSRTKFQKGLESIKPSQKTNPTMKQLYNDFTKEGTPGGIALQLEEGFESVLENLDDLEKRIKQVQKTLPNPTDYKKQFPGNFQEKLRENKKPTRKILSNAEKQADKIFKKYEQDYESTKDYITSLHSKISKEIKKQTKEPDSNWSETFNDYPEPGEEKKNVSERKRVEKYVIFRNRGTIGGIEIVLSNARNHLQRIEDVNKKFGKERNRLENFEIDEDLRRVLEEKDSFRNFSKFSREEIYELSPPSPLKSDPNLSVYHEIEIESINFERLDPLGYVSKSAPPTPIYLWFIDTIIYWAQWDVTIEIKEPIVEEIFDYRNQTIPRPILDNSAKYVHKALPYKQNFDKSKFSFPLIVLSLRNFSISTS